MKDDFFEGVIDAIKSYWHPAKAGCRYDEGFRLAYEKMERLSNGY